MRYGVRAGLLLVSLCAFLYAQDDFKREGNPDQRAKKDPLENKPPPALQVEGWMNAGEEGLDLSALRGKVVLLDFWGTW